MQLVSEFVSPSNEAFAILAIENCYARWLCRAQKERANQEVNHAQLPKLKFVEQRRDGNVGGWRVDGYRRHKELHELVAQDQCESHAELEESHFAVIKCHLQKGKMQNWRSS